MTQTYRTNDFARWGAGQGFNLSPHQVDINFWDLIQRMLAQEARPDPSAGIAYFEIVGVMMYVHMTDGEVLGPYELPVAIFRDRGVWTPNVPYSRMDTFSIDGGLWVVIFDHTSGTSFDPGANNGAGSDYYQLMLQTPGSSLPSGGVVGMSLIKATTTDYSTTWGRPDASNVSFTPATGSTLSSYTVDDALEELSNDISQSIDDIVVIADDVVFTPVTGSNLSSTNVADALEELASVDTALGRQTLWIPATAMIARITNGPSLGTVEMPTNKNMIKTLDFDANTVEYAQFDVAMPKSWDLGDIYFKVFWSHAATSATAGVTFAMEMCKASNNESLDIAFIELQSVTDTGGTGNQMYVSDESSLAMALSVAYGDLIMFRVSRDPVDSADTLIMDARLHGIQLYYTINEITDD